jgi:hypothetical protein
MVLTPARDSDFTARQSSTHGVKRLGLEAMLHGSHRPGTFLFPASSEKILQ